MHIYIDQDFLKNSGNSYQPLCFLVAFFFEPSLKFLEVTLDFFFGDCRFAGGCLIILSDENLIQDS
jgi:hypothetical protein